MLLKIETKSGKYETAGLNNYRVELVAHNIMNIEPPKGLHTKVKHIFIFRSDLETSAYELLSFLKTIIHDDVVIVRTGCMVAIEGDFDMNIETAHEQRYEPLSFN